MTDKLEVTQADRLIYVQWSDDGQHIRKWAREPFAGATAFANAGNGAPLGPGDASEHYPVKHLPFALRETAQNVYVECAPHVLEDMVRIITDAANVIEDRTTHSGEGRSYGAGEDAVRKVFAAWDRHCDALTRTNAAIPEIDATPAERAAYDERYRASEEARRDWYAAMHTFVNDPAARALATLTPKSDGMRDATQSYLCPTPWCSREDAPHIWQGVNDKYYVTCPSCGVNGPDADDDTDAWDKWCWRGVDDKPKPVDPVKFVNDLLRAELLAAGATDYAKLVDEPKSLWWMPIVRKAMLATLTPQGDGEIERAFRLGDRVSKKSGSNWHGHVVGFYSTALTPVGYAVESEREAGSVQIYPEAALQRNAGGERT